MFTRIHQKLGTAGFVISIVALVAALSGGAYAASGALTAKQKKEVEKIAKKVGSKPGATGPVGPAGATGPAGAPGAAGAAGKDGKNGTNGSNGLPGESVNVTTLASGEGGCAAGGAKFSNASGTASACNGTSGGGGGGETVFPTLPSGKTETGTFYVHGANAENAVSLSFPIPLSAADASTIAVHLSIEPDFATSCEGSANAPSAKPGNLCVYIAFSTALNPPEIYPPDFSGSAGGVGTSGAQYYAGQLGNQSEAYGSFAVTAP